MKKIIRTMIVIFIVGMNVNIKVIASGGNVTGWKDKEKQNNCLSQKISLPMLHPWLQGKLMASLGYMRPSLKK